MNDFPEIAKGWPVAERIIEMNIETGEVTVIYTGITRERVGQSEDM